VAAIHSHMAIQTTTRVTMQHFMFISSLIHWIAVGLRQQRERKVPMICKDSGHGEQDTRQDEPVSSRTQADRACLFMMQGSARRGVLEPRQKGETFKYLK